ncbi:MAG: hypothetical protein WCC00_09505 [Candidatus Aminicenantales bacterium]
MDFCKTADLLYAAIPLRPFRDWLIRAHMERCPRCQARLLSRDEAKSLLVGPEQVGGPDGLWRRIAGAAGRAASVPEIRPSRGSLAWRAASVAAMAAVAALTGFWLLREIERPDFRADVSTRADRLRIDYVNVGGAPARTFIYQPQGTDTVFVWVSRNSQKEG